MTHAELLSEGLFFQVALMLVEALRQCLWRLCARSAEADGSFDAIFQ